MTIKYLTCTPHIVHQEFARSINAKMMILPFVNVVNSANEFWVIRKLYPILALLLSIFIKIEEDIVLIEGAATLFYLPVLKFKNKTLKVIYLDGDLTLNTLSKRKTFKFMNQFYKHVDGIISLSEVNKVIASKLFNIPVVSAYPFPQDVTLQKIKRENFALYLGRLSPEKNITRIIDFAERSKYISKLIICGNGPLKQYVETKARYNPAIEYLGYVKNISEQFSRCKFLLHFAEADTYPCTVLEAAVCGCFPIISTTIGSSFIFDEKFKISDIRDDDLIDSKLNWILENDQEAKELLAKSRLMIKTKVEAVANFQVQFIKLLDLIKLS